MNRPDRCTTGADSGGLHADTQVLWNGRMERGTALTDYPGFSRDPCDGPPTVVDDRNACGIPIMSRRGRPDAEPCEPSDSVLFMWRRLNVNSAGPGKGRGGLSTHHSHARHGTESPGGFHITALHERPGVGTGGGSPAGRDNQRSVRQAVTYPSLQLRAPDSATGRSS